MGAGYGSSYSLESVAGAVAQRLAMFAAREARNLLMNDANMTGSVADLTESAADFAHGAGTFLSRMQLPHYSLPGQTPPTANMLNPIIKIDCQLCVNVYTVSTMACHCFRAHRR